VVARARGGRLKGGRFRFEPVSVGATINVMLAAVMAEGESVLENVAVEPDVVVFGECLRQMGAQIDGLGTKTLTIQGVSRLDAVDFWNSPDRIELGTYMIAAVMAGEPGGTFEITRALPEHLGMDLPQTFSAAPETNGPHETITVQIPERIQPVSVVTSPYPGFATDLQAQWTVLMTQADGTAKIEDTIYTDRFKHIPELARMGAHCTVLDN